MKFLYTNEKGGKIGHVTAYGPIAAVKIAKILKICCTVGCALIVLQQGGPVPQIFFKISKYHIKTEFF